MFYVVSPKLSNYAVKYFSEIYKGDYEDYQNETKSHLKSDVEIFNEVSEQKHVISCKQQHALVEHVCTVHVSIQVRLGAGDEHHAEYCGK